MNNTPEQSEFFRTLARGDPEEIRAAVRKDPDILNSYDYRNFGATPLTMACFSNRPSLVALLLALGADPNKKSDWHMGPWSPLHCAIFRRDKELAGLLLAHGASLDIHTASGIGNCDAVSRLLADDPSRVMERGGDGCFPLHFADTIPVAQLLLERGAVIDGRCIDHHSTPVQYLCSIRPDVARYLLSVGAQPDLFSSITCGDTETVESLLESDPNLIQSRINQICFPPGPEHDVHNTLSFSIGFDATPLHAAAKGNQAKLILPLVSRGLSPNVRGGYDQATPLHTAAWNNCLEAAKALLDQGSDIDARSGKLHNNSPAGWAIVAGADKVFELLMDCGAERLPWFDDDARAACSGQFDPVGCAPQEQRQRILSRLSQ